MFLSIPLAFEPYNNAACDLKILRDSSAVIFAVGIALLLLADSLQFMPGLATGIQIVCVVLCLGALLPTTPQETVATEERLHAAAAIVLGAIGALAGVVGWLAGTPAFAHDWKWPLDALQMHDQLASLASIWLPWGSGAPAVQALGNYPITLLSWMLGTFLSSNAALLIVIALIGGVGGWGIAALSAQSGLAKPYQAVLALCIAALPAWFNRLDAGHLQWLLGYALAPCALAVAAASMSKRKTAGALGALFGLAGGQAQFMLFFPLAALPLAVRSRKLIALVASLPLMIGLQLPAVVAMVYASRFSAFAPQHTNLTWQAAQSDPIHLALLAGADPAHYFGNWITPPVLWLSLLTLAFVAVGAFANAMTRTLAALWLVFAVWSSGLDGPLRTPLAWMFTHVPDAIALREFAHAQVIVAPLLAVLCAHGVARCVRALKLRTVAGPAATFLALLPLTAAAFSGTITHLSIPVPASSDRDAAVDAIAGLPGAGQILWWPGLQPIAFANLRGGVDSDAFVTGAHAPYEEYRPTAALAHAIVALSAGDRAACGLLADLGIQAVVVRDGTTIPAGTAFASLSVPSASVMARAGLREIGRHGSYRLYAVPCYAGNFTIANDAQLSGDWSTIVDLARRAGATDERTSAPAPPAGCLTKAFLATSYHSTDVAQDWVPLSELDAIFLQYDNAFDDVLVTRSQRVADASVVLAAQSTTPFSWVPAARANELVPATIAVWKIAQCPPQPGATPRGLAQGAAARPYGDGPNVLLKPSLVVAHYGKYAGWRLLARGEGAPQPVLADGYATGWLLTPGRWELALEQIGPPVGLLWAGACLAAFVSLLLAAIPDRK
jgi:hypothetical protein